MATGRAIILGSGVPMAMVGHFLSTRSQGLLTAAKGLGAL